MTTQEQAKMNQKGEAIAKLISLSLNWSELASLIWGFNVWHSPDIALHWSAVCCIMSITLDTISWAYLFYKAFLHSTFFLITLITVNK